MAEYCGRCGALLMEGDSFCRSCGTPVGDDAPTEVAGGFPASTAVLAATTYAPAPVAAPANSRPRWVFPIIGAVVALVAAAVIAIVLASKGSGPALLADQVRLIVAPVNTDVAQLASVQASTKTKADLAAVKSAAARLETDAAAAKSELDTIKVRSTEASALSLLRTAVASAGDYGHSTAAAAANPSAGLVGAARASADSARTNFTTIAASLSTLIFPPASSFNVDAIATVVTAQDATKQQASQSAKSATTYVHQIDQLLTNSSETRGNLGDLINGVTTGTITSGEAKSQIAGILNQRQGLQNSVATIDPPTGFKASERLLRDSLAAAIADDYAIQGWIDAWDQNDRYTFDQFWQKHLAATRAATSAKEAFVTEYDSARRRTLHLGLLKIGSNY